MLTKNFNRRGISAVVATIAIILITISAAAFLAGFVVPLVKNQLQEGTECVGYGEYFTFYEEFDYNCYRQETDGRYYYALSVQGGSASAEKAEKIKGLRLQFLGGGDSEGIEVIEGQSANNEGIRMLDANVLFMAVPLQGEVRTYVYSSPNFYDSVELYPVLNSDRICEKSDDLRLQGFACVASLNLNIQ